jgi:malate dehydrogenase (oxaloacetate-decarboxylating)(NADP+)
LSQVIEGADVFIGVSGANLLNPMLLNKMSARPVIFALANPDPEILPSEAFKVRNDILMATGRSDFPNQVNNVLGFPFLFRGALDAKASKITTKMLLAAADALAGLAREPVPASVLKIYNLPQLIFGKDYFIPKPFDPRLIEWVAKAVERAAIE